MKSSEIDSSVKLICTGDITFTGIFNFRQPVTRYSYVNRTEDNPTSAPVSTENKLLDLEKYRLKLKLKDAGVEWHEDQKGKFKIWVRLAAHTQSLEL